MPYVPMRRSKTTKKITFTQQKTNKIKKYNKKLFLEWKKYIKNQTTEHLIDKVSLDYLSNWSSSGTSKNKPMQVVC